MTIHPKLKKARMGLLLREPFFAAMAMRFRYVASTEHPTTACDGRTFFYNPDWCDAQSIDRLQTAIAHNVMHIAQLHHLRIAGRDPTAWDEACDIVVNSLLDQARFRLSPEDVTDPSYDGASVEQIYQDRDGEKDEEGGGGSGGQPENEPGEGDSKADGGEGNQPGCGQVLPAPQDMDHGQERRDLKSEISAAMRQAEKAGKMPADLKREIDKAASVIDWRAVLREFITRSHIRRYDFSRPSRRALSTNVILPKRVSDAVNCCAVVVDTSGSINRDLLSRFEAELNDMLDGHSVAEMVVICCDAAVQSVTRLGAGDQLEFDIKGGGGTSFQPALVAAAKEEPDLLVYFTDMLPGDRAEIEEPEFPVLWLDYGPSYLDGVKYKPEFGEIVKTG